MQSTSDDSPIPRRSFLALLGVSAVLPALASAESSKPNEEAIRGPAERLQFNTEYLFTRVSRVRREVIGPVAEGFRVNIYTEGGEVRGPRVSGETGRGADAFTVRTDGMGVIDSRVTIHAAAAASIFTYYTGVTDLGEDAHQRILHGDLPVARRIFIAARFQTAHPDYLWLNRIQAVGIGTNEGETNRWEMYALR